ncbi:MAG: LruC domain-containing protein [Candidatus Sericytochromatia bacterium]
MKRHPILTTASLALISLINSGFTLINNQYNWTFQASGTYSVNYDGQGIPYALDPAQRKTYPDDFWTRLSASLPEQIDIRKTSPTSITNDTAANLHMLEEGDVTVTFLHEGAGYRNSFGYFVYDQKNPPQNISEIKEKIVFPNTSFSGSGGNSRGLKSGDSLVLGRFQAGQSLGFVIVSDGFDSSKGVKSSLDSKRIFTTLSSLNPETDPALRAHTVLLYDQATQQAVLGLEDMPRDSSSCDHDFNDVIFTLSANPPEAVDSSALKPLPEAIDSDKDGVLDANDQFPQDATRAFYQYYPEQGQRSTLAFEDNWPAQGDYDMNDLVLNYAFENITNSQGQVKDIQVNFELAARGADLHNAFALEIPGISPSNLAKAELTIGNQSKVLTPENGQKNVVFNLIDDASRYLTQGTGKCRFYNTQIGCAGRPGQSFGLKLTLKSPVANTAIGLPPYNPFIYRTDQRGYEIHLPNHPPTDRASSALFKTRDDNSAPGNYYKTKSNLPWALNIPNLWTYPAEQTEISSAYLDFKTWAESSGAQNRDWYRQNSQAPLLWK